MSRRRTARGASAPDPRSRYIRMVVQAHSALTGTPQEDIVVRCRSEHIPAFRRGAPHVRYVADPRAEPDVVTIPGHPRWARLAGGGR